MQRKLHIILDVIDNAGDMGFALELILAHAKTRTGYTYIVWTNAKERVSSFFEKNREDLPEVYFEESSLYHAHHDEVTLLLFHTPLPNIGSSGSGLVLRIDYLSFDPEWIRSHGSEHIYSTGEQRIYEIIPSPLPSSGGLLPLIHSNLIEKNRLAEKYSLDVTKPWITLFCYPDHLELIDLSSSDEYEIILFANEGNSSHANIHSLPMIPVRDFQAFLRASKWAIVRGEVSMVSALRLSIPFLWDMYHSRGGFPLDQSRDFLSWMDLGRDYHDLHDRLNGRTPGGIKLREVGSFFQKNAWYVPKIEGSLLDEIEKYIDSFYKSL